MRRPCVDQSAGPGLPAWAEMDANVGRHVGPAVVRDRGSLEGHEDRCAERPVLACLGDRELLAGRGEVGKCDHLAGLNAPRDDGLGSRREREVACLAESGDSEAER